MDILLILIVASIALVAHVVTICWKNSAVWMRISSLLCIPVLVFYILYWLPKTDAYSPLTWSGQWDIGWLTTLAITMAAAELTLHWMKHYAD